MLLRGSALMIFGDASDAPRLTTRSLIVEPRKLIFN
jgi:hypothetical protein